MLISTIRKVWIYPLVVQWLILWSLSEGIQQSVVVNILTGSEYTNEILEARVYDWDQDGVLDVHVPGLPILNGRNLSELQSMSSTGLDAGLSMDIADFDGDGRVDFVACGTFVGGGASSSVPRLVVGFANAGSAFTLEDQAYRYRQCAVIALDWDRDGDADFIVSGNDGLIETRVHLNQGAANGSRAQFVSKTAVRGYSLVGMTSVDLHVDGFPDLFIISADGALLVDNAGSEDGTDTVTATYLPALPVLSSERTLSPIVRSGDVDNDGLVDVVVASAKTLTILYSDIEVFEPVPVSNVPAINGLCLVELLDVNLDGYLDILFSCPIYPSNFRLTIRIAENLGNRTVAVLPMSPILFNSTSLLPIVAFQVVDVDHDGILELLTVTPGSILSGGSLQVTLQNVPAVLQPTAAANYTSSIALPYQCGDGVFCMALYESVEAPCHCAYRVSWSLGNDSSGTALGPSYGMASRNVSTLSSGTVSGYSSRVLSVRHVQPGQLVCLVVETLSRSGRAQMQSKSCLYLPTIVKSSDELIGQVVESMDFADMDGNGYQDLVLAGHGMGDDLATSIVYYTYSPDEGFVDQLVGNLPAQPTGRLALADLDHDGSIELILCGMTDRLQVYSYQVTAQSSFVNVTDSFVDLSSSLTAQCSFGSLAAEDINGDGWTDLVTLGAPYPCDLSSIHGKYFNVNCTGPYVSQVLINPGGGSRRMIARNSSGIPAWILSTVKFVDLDGDRDLDLVVAGVDPWSGSVVTGGLAVYECALDGQGYPTYTLKVTLNSQPLLVPALDVADYNQDGFLDVLYSGAPRTSNAKTQIMLFRGSGAFSFENRTADLPTATVTGVQSGFLVFFDIDGTAASLSIAGTGATNSDTWSTSGGNAATSFALLNVNGTFVDSGITPFGRGYNTIGRIVDYDRNGKYNVVGFGVITSFKTAELSAQAVLLTSTVHAPLKNTSVAPNTPSLSFSSNGSITTVQWTPLSGLPGASSELIFTTLNGELLSLTDTSLRFSPLNAKAFPSWGSRTTLNGLYVPVRLGRGNMGTASSFQTQAIHSTTEFCVQVVTVFADHRYTPPSEKACRSFSTTASTTTSAAPDSGASSTSSSALTDWQLGVLAGGASGLVLLVLLAVCCLICVLLAAVAIALVGLLLVVVVVALLAAAALGGGGGTAFWAVRKVRSAQMSLEEALEVAGDLEIHGKYRELAFEDLQFIEKIGEGAFGQVYRGRWKGALVAIKTIDINTSNEAAIEEARREAEIMTAIGNHPNIVTFVGAVTEGRQFCLVTEFCANGSLYDLLVKEGLELSALDRLRMIRDAAAGLAYLHSMEVVHRDIAMRNCLVGDKMQVLISDFGTSRLCEQAENENSTKSNVGPVRWMAPEAIKNKTYSNKSDSWSFGVLVWELLNRRVPYEGLSVFDVAVGVSHGTLQLSTLIPWGDTVTASSSSSSSAKTQGSPDKVLQDVMEMCLVHDPDRRASMAEVMQRIQRRMADLGILDDSTDFSPSHARTSQRGISGAHPLDDRTDDIAVNETHSNVSIASSSNKPGGIAIDSSTNPSSMSTFVHSEYVVPSHVPE